MGNMEQIPAGEFQIMSAGTGVRHSEYNPSNEKELRLYQIWIIPDKNGIEPRYEQKRFDSTSGKQLVLSPDARDGSLKVNQDMTLWRWALPANEQSTYDIAEKRVVWIQVVKGNIEVNGQKATASDGLAIWQENQLTSKADEDSEILVFDLPAAE
jgi:redox-sensitive bicupin YhaK (pirin superfamily)